MAEDCECVKTLSGLPAQGLNPFESNPQYDSKNYRCESEPGTRPALEAGVRQFESDHTDQF